MKPGQMHSWDMKKNIKGILVEFSHQSLNSIRESDQIIGQLNNSPDLISSLEPVEFRALVAMAEMMRNEFEEKLERYDLSLQAGLTAFLIRLLRHSTAKPNPEKNSLLIHRFRMLVEKNFRKFHTVEFYSKQLNISAKALTMQLTRAVGKPPRQIIQERILLESKRFLAFSELGISEIGYELGFEDPNYFTRFFRLHEKKTPAAFRREALIPCDHGCESHIEVHK